MEAILHRPGSGVAPTFVYGIGEPTDKGKED